MIVKYVNDQGYEGKGYPYCTLNKDYIVLGLKLKSGLVSDEINIQDDTDGSAIVGYLKDYEIIDHRIPSNWSFNRYMNIITIEPREFDTDDFWELYHDKDPEAEALYEKVVRELYHFHGWPADKVVW